MGDIAGHWVTIDGVHVFIGKGGTIEKGPAALVGKKPGDLPKGKGLGHKVGDTESSYHAAKAAGAAQDSDLVSVQGKPGWTHEGQAGHEKIPSPHGEAISAVAEKYHAALQEFRDSIKSEGGVTVAAAEKFKPMLAHMKATLEKAGFKAKSVAADHQFRRYLLPTESAKPVPVPMGLSGFPTEREGHPIEYRSKEICRAGRNVRDVAGNEFPITRERMDRWVTNFNKMLANGMTVPLPTKHFDYESKDNRGFVVAMERKGDSLFATEQLIGADAVLDAARNDQSVFIDFNLPDDRGNVYDEAIAHVAMTPCPQVTGLSGFAKVAASRGAVVDAVVLLDSPAPTQPLTRSPEMDPVIKLFREQLGVADTIPDTELPAVLTAKIAEAKTTGKTEAETAHAAALSRVTAERDEAKAQAVAMSRTAPAMPDENTQMLLMESIAEKRDTLINSGGATAHVAKQIVELFCPGNKPSAVALSRDAGQARPLLFQLLNLLMENKVSEVKGAKTGVQSAVALDRKPVEGDDADAAKQGREQGEAYKKAQLEARGIAAA